MLEGISPDQLQMTDTPRLIWIPVREAVKLRWQRNPKSHDLGILSESIRKHGFKSVPHYDSFIGVDDGNGRVECLDWMERQGQPIVRGIATATDGTWVMPLIVGVDDKSKALAESYAIDANNLVLSGAEFAPWEIAKLWDEQGYVAILQELAGGDALPVSVDGEALNALLQSEPEPEPQDPGELVDKAAELQAKWQVERGDVWQVGKHRVMCGDSTNAADVARLMGGEKARMWITDLPYGVGYEYASHDDSDESAYFDLCNRFMQVNLSLGAFGVVTIGHRHHNWWVETFHPESFLIWYDKTKQSPHKIAYLCKSELIFSFGKPNARYAWDTFEVQGVRGDGLRELHTCPKPVELFVKLIEPQTSRGESVYDSFTGSGTTLVACEQTGRVGRGMEIEPKYCAVTLERLSGLGLTPQRPA